MSFSGFIKRSQFWLRDILKNQSSIYEPYKEIQTFENAPFEKAAKIQNEKLKKLLTHAQKNTSFYKNFSSLSLNDYPVVHKMFLIEHGSEIAVDKKNIPGQKGKIHIQTTSGSTGTPFAIPQDTRKRNRRIAELKYFGKIVGFKSHEMLVHLRTWNKWQQKTKKQIQQERIIPFDIANMGENRLEELCHTIQKIKAICIRGYASSLGILANYLKNNPHRLPSLQIAIAGSEALHDDVRTNVKKYLSCEIISQYADEECGILAQERIPTQTQDNPMYLNHAGYIFEFLKQDSDEPVTYGELARIVITDLHNYAFPIIRYDTGDVGILNPPNSFSHGWPILGKLFGRRLDVCYTTDGEPFSPMTIGRILKHYTSIMQWQFIQTGEKNYTLKIIVRALTSNTENLNALQSTPNILKDITNLLKEQIGTDALITIEQVTDIPVLASGKRKPVVNEWKNGETT